MSGSVAGSPAEFAQVWAAHTAPSPEPEERLDGDAERALAAIEDKNPVVLVSGRAGTGKSRFISRLQSGQKGARTLVVAPTGIAALNLGVPTIHAAFHLPLGCLDAAHLLPSNRPMGALRSIVRLVIDEISMVRADVLDAIDARLRAARRTDAPFGGVQVVMVGDFLQLPPVVTEDEGLLLRELGYETPFAFSAHALRDMPITAVTLRTVWRQADPSFKAALADIRSGRNTQAAVEWLNRQCLGPHREGHTPLVLATTRALADEYNARGLEAVFARHPAVRFSATRTGTFELGAVTPAPEHLDVAPGARVVALRNDARGLYANGSLGTVVDTRLAKDGEDSAVLVEFDSGGEPVWVERASWERTRAVWSEAQGRLVAEPVGGYAQIPLAPGYALTVHKSQGLTLDDVRLDLGRGAFAPGQLYVALSRARTIEGMSFVQPLTPADARVDAMLRKFLEWADARSLTKNVATSPFQAAALVGEPQAGDAFSPGAPAHGRNL